ncbi:hypothetical protein HDU91_002043 [Kappamyces sp. JEL0680]|nr:hypothetical protein HDU91_002043 [Kappamyces sp. JEL0680]
MKFSYILFATAIVARPTGAPACGINESKIQQGMNSASDATLGYGLRVAKVSSSPATWTVQVENSRGRQDYQGLLLYVTSASPSEHLGSFSFLNATKWKFQPESLCSSANITGTTLGTSTVTHANPDRVALAKNVTFTWTATANEIAKGSLSFQAVVASVDSGAFPRWQHISVPFGAIASSSATAMATAMATTATSSPYGYTTYPASATTTFTSSAWSLSAAGYLLPAFALLL